MASGEERRCLSRFARNHTLWLAGNRVCFGRSLGPQNVGCLPMSAREWHVRIDAERQVIVFGRKQSPLYKHCAASAEPRISSDSSALARTHKITLQTRTRFWKQAFRNEDHHAGDRET